MELICGACHGRLLAEIPGTTVACPHCGTHLQTPAAAAPPVELPLSLDTEDDPAHAANAEGDTVNINLAGQLLASPPGGTAAEAFVTANPPSATSLPSSEATGVETTPFTVPESPEPAATTPAIPPQISSVSGASQVGETGAQAHNEFLPGVTDHPRSGAVLTTVAEGFLEQFAASNAGLDALPPAEQPVSAVGAFAEGGVAASGVHEAPVDDEFVPASVSVEETLNNSVPAGDETRNADEELAAIVQAAPEVIRKGVSPIAFLLVASYASAMTLACLFLLYQRKHNPGTLDLPDLAPPAQTVEGKKRVSLKKFLPEEKPVPVANVLKLGESRQYGSVKVTPLRVTRGPVEFRFYKADEDQFKDQEGPVLKLHLRFENVSPDQDFIPLDSELVYAKDVDSKTREMFNHHNFVSSVAERGKRAKHAYVFDLKPGGMWLIKDQRLDERLGPGEVLETFIPTTTEEIEALEGDLVWRVHFRKGYNRTSYRGVTTLIEVLFNSSEIVDDEPRLPDEPIEQPATEPEADQPAAKPTTVKDA